MLPSIFGSTSCPSFTKNLILLLQLLLLARPLFSRPSFRVPNSLGRCVFMTSPYGSYIIIINNSWPSDTFSPMPPKRSEALALDPNVVVVVVTNAPRRKCANALCNEHRCSEHTCCIAGCWHTPGLAALRMGMICWGGGELGSDVLTAHNYYIRPR